MLPNPNSLDPNRYIAYNQQAGNAAYGLGNLTGGLVQQQQTIGMQQLGVRGGIAGLQGVPGAQQQQQQQQIGQGRFPPQALQTNLQQLGNFQRQGVLANQANSLANGMAAAAAAAAGGRGIGAINMGNNPALGGGATAIRPGGGANTGLANLGSTTAGGLNLGYGQGASLAAALGVNQQQLNMNRLAANLQNTARLGLGSVNLLQGGGGLTAAPGGNPSHDLLAIIGGRKPQTNPYENVAAQQQQQQQQQQQLLGGGGFLGNLGGLHDELMRRRMEGEPGSGPGPLDETNYPTLGGGGGNGRLMQQGGGGLLAGTSQQQLGDAAGGYGGMRKGGGGGGLGGSMGSEFSMQNEDFPALGGGGGGRGGFPLLSSTGPGDPLLQQQGGGGGAADFEQMLRYQQQQQQSRAAAAAAGATLRGGAPGGGGTMQDKAAAVAAAAPDRHGLLGLMPLLKMADADLTMLTLGTDLTSLGLNLNSSEALHRGFVAPLTDVPVRLEPEFDLPACYRHTPQRLQAGYLGKFKEETLFYVFYSMPQEEAQFVAADELYTRGWFWHRRVKLWMIASPNAAAAPQKTARGERGSYLVFDPSVWEVVPKGDVEIAYEELEPHPRLARGKQLVPPQQQQQQQQQGGGAAGAAAAAGALGQQVGGGQRH